MRGKQLQFELWQECNSRCKFCYLAHDNCYTSDKIKIDSIKMAYDKISDLSLYPEYSTISYLGGEFFQGQMKSKEVKEEFMNLIDKTVWLLNNEYIDTVWIYATLTIGDQKDLYETLEKFKGHKGNLWILTSYDTIGRFHTKKMEDNWSYHMKQIHKLYPDILFNITTILTGDLIDKYLNDEINFEKMMEEYHTKFFFKQCGNPYIHKTKQDMNNVLPNFFPTRQKFLDFLIKFKQQESPEMWDKLFNIYYRADNLYRNFNDENEHMVEFVRDKDTSIEHSKYLEDPSLLNTVILPCGHMNSYQAYIDTDDCVLCDRQMIEEMCGD